MARRGSASALLRSCFFWRCSLGPRQPCALATIIERGRRLSIRSDYGRGVRAPPGRALGVRAPAGGRSVRYVQVDIVTEPFVGPAILRTVFGVYISMTRLPLPCRAL